MKITLNLDGFKKQIEIESSIYDRGIVFVGVSPLAMEVANTQKLERNINTMEIPFYRMFNSKEWMPKQGNGTHCNCGLSDALIGE